MNIITAVIRSYVYTVTFIPTLTRCEFDHTDENETEKKNENELFTIKFDRFDESSAVCFVK